MTSPPLTKREYAYVAITGPGTHEAITAQLRLSPSEAWNMGDIHPRNGKPRPRMSWILASGLDDTQALNLHIDTLLNEMTRREAEIRQLWDDYDLYLVCVGYYPPSGHGMHFDREQVRRAAKLGLALDLDFYYVDDHGHEV